MKLVVCSTPIKHGRKSLELNIYFVNEIGCLLYTNKTWTQKSRIKHLFCEWNWLFALHK